MSPRRFLAFILCYVFVLPLFAWWETGHRTVARIAAAHLNPATRSRVAQILGVKDTPDSVANAMAVASTWPDEIKDQSKTGAWHFIDIPLQDSKKDMRKRCPEGDNCITARIEIFADQLKDRAPSTISDRDALRYLIHFVGDIHQPLHATSDADLGGNCEQIKPIEQAKNLHALWDGGIVKTLHANDVQLADNLEGYIGRLSSGDRKRWSKGDAADWAWESSVFFFMKKILVKEKRGKR